MRRRVQKKIIHFAYFSIALCCAATLASGKKIQHSEKTENKCREEQWFEVRYLTFQTIWRIQRLDRKGKHRNKKKTRKSMWQSFDRQFFCLNKFWNCTLNLCIAFECVPLQPTIYSFSPFFSYLWFCSPSFVDLLWIRMFFSVCWLEFFF